MPTNTVLSRVNTIDFFAIVLPGFYFTCALSLFAFGFLDRPTNAKGPWDIIKNAIANIHVNGAIFILLASHLLGSVVRSLPVAWPDAISAKLVRIFFRRGQAEVYDANFPFPLALENWFKKLGGHEVFKIRFDSTEETIHLLFNFWKAEICQKSADLFSYTLSAEARVRMFAGIIWATGLALVIGLIQLALPSTRQWWEPSVLLIIVSFVICLIFLWRLRYMRREEARIVFLAYLALHKKENLSSSPATPMPSVRLTVQAEQE
jgi:hypothetical protein